MSDPTTSSSIVITGASGGLGQALCQALARPGPKMLLLGRDEDRLRAAADLARTANSPPDTNLIETAPIAVTDSASLQARLQDFDNRSPVDLLICCAGTKVGNTKGIEAPGQASRVVEVNLTGVINTVETLLPAMMERGAGRIVLIGSLAGVAPHISLLSYSASKAGLHAYAKALRRALRGTGVEVTLVIPGFIDTPMTRRHHGPAPMSITAEKAARIIIKGLARRRSTIVFPKLLAWLSWCGELLPSPLADAIMARYRADIEPDADERCDVKT